MVVTTLLLPLRSPWVTRAALTCAIFVASGAWAPAVACSCAFSGPPCQAYWNSDAVFDATVVKIEPATPEVLIGEQVIRHTMRRVTLNVTHAWKGVQTGTLQVVTNPDGASCGFDFKEGSRYLVFARRGQLSEIEVSRCSATRSKTGWMRASEPTCSKLCTSA